MEKKEHAAKHTKIEYGCKNGECTATPKKPHIFGAGSHVELLATTTNVKVAFNGGKSPFQPNAPTIDLTMGVSQTFTVSSTASGNYRYQIQCLHPHPCPTPQDEPDMIVP